MEINVRRVYSTDPDIKRCPRCGKIDCSCSPSHPMPPKPGILKISLDKKGRKGKCVTVILGFAVNPDHLKDIAKKLKQQLGTGGTAKHGTIEIQGDHRQKIAQLLADLGYKSKFSGG
ncbi:stress response translation initiation inhibitor YciH [candidate division KSB1 bacterium]|nr:stress response translation initiation inhibitor YciH [candidate division KSB1 bacterium]